MKKLLLIYLFIAVASNFYAQNTSKKPFLTGDLNFTFGINENYTLFNDDDESFLKFSAVMFRVGAGYQFNSKWLASFNIGYDHHTRYSINAIPTYGTLRYNIAADDFDAFFAEASYGKMWRPSSKYENGDYYKLGLGVQMGGSGRWHTLLKLDFHRKKIIGFKNHTLDSVSLGIGFIFL